VPVVDVDVRAVHRQSHANRSSLASDGPEEVTREDEYEATRVRLTPGKLPGVGQCSHMSESWWTASASRCTAAAERFSRR